mgnify:CR=1 FL=1
MVRPNFRRKIFSQEARLHTPIAQEVHNHQEHPGMGRLVVRECSMVFWCPHESRPGGCPCAGTTLNLQKPATKDSMTDTGSAFPTNRWSNGTSVINTTSAVRAGSISDGYNSETQHRRRTCLGGHVGIAVRRWGARIEATAMRPPEVGKAHQVLTRP